MWEIPVAMSGGHAFEDREDGRFVAPVLRSLVASAVLGLVIEKPSHGYEIAQRFELRFGGFLPAPKKNSIYEALRALVDAGLIERTTAVARRGAKSYRATAEGGRAYRAWLAEEVRSDPQRAAMLGRMTLAGVRTVDAALEFVDRYERECLREAKALGPRSALEGSGLSGVMERLLLEEQRRMVDARLGWISYAKAELRGARDLSGGGEGEL